MDAKIINPFLTAAIEVYRNMFGIVPNPGSPFLLEEETKHRWDISGILGVTGDYTGIVCFRLHKILADKLLIKSGIKIYSEKERNETVYEMVGEITNIISGNAASNISHANIEISPPAVIMGENHIIAWPKPIPVIGIPFTTSSGPFEVDVYLKRKNILLKIQLGKVYFNNYYNVFAIHGSDVLLWGLRGTIAST
jgi:chemotaxis protein CheX